MNQAPRASATPTHIRMGEGNTLDITWSDGVISRLPLAVLRRHCPCATCQAEKTARGPAYIPLYSRESLRLSRLEPLGYYALQVTWMDGHNTGIYPYDTLRELGSGSPPESHGT